MNREKLIRFLEAVKNKEVAKQDIPVFSKVFNGEIAGYNKEKQAILTSNDLDKLYAKDFEGTRIESEDTFNKILTEIDANENELILNYRGWHIIL